MAKSLAFAFWQQCVDFGSEKMIRQLIRYGVVGLFNTAIDVGMLNLLIQVFGWQLIIANTAAASLAVINSYFWNKYWTFTDYRPRHLQQFSLFVAVNVIWVLLSDTLVYFGTQLVISLFPHWPYWWQYNPVKLGVVGLTMILNFIVYKWIIFRNER